MWFSLVQHEPTCEVKATKLFWTVLIAVSTAWLAHNGWASDTSFRMVALFTDQAGVVHKINNASSLTLTAGSGAELRVLQDFNWWELTQGGSSVGTVGPQVLIQHRDCGEPVGLQVTCAAGHVLESAREATPVPGPGARKIA